MKNFYKYILGLILATVFFLPVGTALAATGGCTDPKTCLDQSPIVKDINQVVNFLSAGVAVIVVLSIVLGGIQYILAGDKPEAVNAAKQRITNSLIALAAFLLTFSFLQWLIPGGIFG